MLQRADQGLLRQVFRQLGIGIAPGANPGENFLEIPLHAMFGNPDLLGQVGIGKLALEFALGHQYRNDEQIDDSLRSVMFQIPKPGANDPTQCGKPILLPDCFSVVQDLGAIDVARGRDHGIPTYNALRERGCSKQVRPLPPFEMPDRRWRSKEQRRVEALRASARRLSRARAACAARGGC